MVRTYTAPSAWAPLLINGDASGMTPGDEVAAQAWLASINLGAPADCEDAGFRWHHDAWRFCKLAADCQTYTFLERN